MRRYGGAGSTLKSYNIRTVLGKEDWMTVTCTFYSLSNEAPHKVGAVFTPVRAPERVHLEDSSRKENYRKWPNYFTDININVSKQGRIPLLWRHHIQSLEASLYHRRKGRKKHKKDLTAKTLADLWEMGALHLKPSRAAEPGLGVSAPRPCGAEAQWQVAALLPPLGIPPSGQDFSHEARLL